MSYGKHQRTNQIADISASDATAVIPAIPAVDAPVMPNARVNEAKTSATPAAKQRIEWVDISKGIAIICVILGHVLAEDSFFRVLIFSFHMPLFFILAGYTHKIKSEAKVLKSSFKRLILPYLILVCCSYGYWALLAENPFTVERVQDFLLMLLWGCGSSGILEISTVGVPWFLMCLFTAKILFNLLQGLFEKKSVHPVAQLVVYVVLAALGVFVGTVNQLPLPMGLDNALIAMAFMWVGFTARKYSFFEKLGKKWWMVIAGFVAWAVMVNFSGMGMGGHYLLNPQIGLVCAVFGTYWICVLSMLIEKMGTFIKTYLAFMGRNSMAVYCIHTLEWWISWSAIVNVIPLPAPAWITAGLRITYDSLLTALYKKLT